MNVKNFPAKLGYAFFSVALITLIYGFTNSANTQKNEYMSITIEYRADRQFIYVFKKDIEIERIVILAPNKYIDRANRYKRHKYTVIKKDIQSIYDNTTIFELVQKYEVEGWILKNHSIGLGFADESSSERVAQYLMSRKAN